MFAKKAISATAIMGSALLGISASASVATAQTAPTGGAIRVWVTPTSVNGLVSTIVVTGAIGDYGKAISSNANGTPDVNGNYVKIELHKGGFMVNSTALNKKSNGAQPVANATTCSGWLSVSDPVTLFDGTGLYKGISGTVNITETFSFVAPVNASGPNAGKCNENGQPLGFYASIVGSGTVSFS
jgi:hypothetical protein